MSTDRSRLVSAIRRIVLTDPDLSSALDAWQNRGDQASSTGVGTSDAERDRLCCDGSTSDNPNPGADTRDTSEGGQDGLNADDPALLDSGPGSLTGVTDCATGEPVCFEGNDWLPPEGWDSPTDPGFVPFFEEGIYYGNVLGSCPSVIPDEVATCTGLDFIAPCEDCEAGNVGPCDGDGSIGYRAAETVIVEGEEKVRCGDVIHKYECGDSEEDYCNPDPEEYRADSWPEDGCTNLAIKNGSIVGSKYDPENDGTYSKPMSEIELCDGSGNSFFLSPSSDGGWKTIDATKTDGYLYDSQGNKIAHIDGNEYADPDV